MPLDQTIEFVSKECAFSISEQKLHRWADVSKIVGVDDAGLVCLRQWPHFNPQTISEMAQRALLELGTPTHFMKIIDKMNYLFPKRAPFGEHSVHGRLGWDTHIFVCLGKGMYALTNWGIKRPPFIKEFLASAILEKGGIATEGDLIRSGQERHGYKETSMKMTLQMNPRIFRSGPDRTWKVL
jgi:hypothetical protein